MPRDPNKCPKCGAEGFGESDGQPVTISGWYGNARYAWGRYAGVHMPRLCAKRCPNPDCSTRRAGQRGIRHQLTTEPRRAGRSGAPAIRNTYQAKRREHIR